MKILARLLLSVAAVSIIGMASTAARADGIVLTGTQIDKLVPPIAVLNFEHHGFKKSESGSVSYDGTNDVISGDISAGPHQQTVAFSSLGLSEPSQLKILLNINEANGGNKMPITVDSLVLTAYDSAGNSVFTASLINGPYTLDQFQKAQGSTSDYYFGLDPEAAARLQAALAADANLRLGLAGSLSNVDGGPERFSFTGEAQATPEPATMVLLGTGLAGIAGAARRRRKAAAAAAKLEAENITI